MTIKFHDKNNNYILYIRQQKIKYIKFSMQYKVRNLFYDDLNETFLLLIASLKDFTRVHSRFAREWNLHVSLRACSTCILRMASHSLPIHWYRRSFDRRSLVIQKPAIRKKPPSNVQLDERGCSGKYFSWRGCCFCWRVYGETRENSRRCEQRAFYELIVGKTIKRLICSFRRKNIALTRETRTIFFEIYGHISDIINRVLMEGTRD